MNENLNLVEILKDCPKGTKLYSIVLGEVELCAVEYNNTYPICVKDNIGNTVWLTSNGKFIKTFGGECVLFPSKEQRNWAEFKPKFDPKTLQPYMKVLVRDTNDSLWRCAFYSHKKEIEDNPYKYVATSSFGSVFCIPYNDDTKHLLGTSDEAPVYYRYWED